MLAGVPVRDHDVEPTASLHWVAILCRTLAALLVVVMVLQILNGLTSTVDISYGVLIAEALRLLIFAGLLWGAGEVVDLFVKSHGDVRAVRILLGRIEHHLADRPLNGAPHAGEPDTGRSRGDATH